MGQPTYATTADLRGRAGLSANPTDDRALTEALDTASRTVERVTGRRYYPTLTTRAIDWPGLAAVNTHPTGKLWLDDNELAATPTQVLVANQAWIHGTHYRVGPNDGPPYRWLEPLPSATVNWTTSPTDVHVDAVEITAEFGYTNTATPVTSLAAAVTTTTETTITVASGARVGVGAALKIGAEWMIVEDVGWAAAADTLTPTLTADLADVSLTVTDSTAYTSGETLLIGLERMQVLDRPTSTTVRVRRAVDGTDTAAHTSGAAIQALRTATVERAALGTAASAHSSGATVARLDPPALVVKATLAAALVELADVNAHYQREIGAAENAREARGAGLDRVMKRLQSELRAPARFRATGTRTGAVRW